MNANVKRFNLVVSKITDAAPVILFNAKHMQSNIIVIAVKVLQLPNFTQRQDCRQTQKGSFLNENYDKKANHPGLIRSAAIAVRL